MKQKLNKLNEKTERKVLHKVKKNWVILSLLSFTLLGVNTTLQNEHFFLPLGTQRVSAADVGVSGYDGSAHWTYDASTKTLTFDGAGTLAGGSIFYGHGVPAEVEHIVFAQKIEAVADSSYLFSTLDGTDSHLKSIDQLDNLDTQNVTNMAGMFSGDIALTSLNLTGLDTRNVTNMAGMFYGVSKLTSLDLSNFDTSKVTDMSKMFLYDSSLESLNISNFNTENVTTMEKMFYNDTTLKSLDLSNFITRNVTNMESMFDNTTALTNLNIANFDTDNVTSMAKMFTSMGDVFDRVAVTLPQKHFDTNAEIGSGFQFITAASVQEGGTAAQPKGQQLATGQYQERFNSGTAAADMYIFGNSQDELHDSTDSQAVQETIRYQYADGSQAAEPVTKAVTFTRPVTTDTVTGYKVFGAWSADQSFAAVTSPTIQGYTPDQSEITSQTVAATSEPLAYTVTYKKNALNPSQPGSRQQPESNAGSSVTEVTPEKQQPAKDTTTDPSDSGTTVDDADQLPALPLTRKQAQHFSGIFWIIVASLAAVVAFLENKKAKK